MRSHRHVKNSLYLIILVVHPDAGRLGQIFLTLVASLPATTYSGVKALPLILLKGAILVDVGPREALEGLLVCLCLQRAAGDLLQVR